MVNIVRITGASDKAHGKKRSSKWAAFRNKFIRAHPACAVCGGKTKLQAHHIIPFSMNPDRELDEKNLIALCEGRSQLNCHLIVGHGGDYGDYNPSCRRSAHFMAWLLKFRQKTIVVEAMA